MLKAFIRLLSRILYRVEVSGAMPNAERLLIVPNHQSFLDAPLLWAWMPINAVWIVHTQIAREPMFRLFLKAADHLVIDTTSPFALKAAIELIEAGRPIIIFPEGRVSVAGTMMKIYDGPAFIAAKSKATIAPIWIDGAMHARFFTKLEGRFRIRTFPKIRIQFFPAAFIPMPEAPSGKIRRRMAGVELRRLMQRTSVEARRRRSLYEIFLDAVSFFGRGWKMAEDVNGEEWTYGRILKSSLALGRLTAPYSEHGDVVGVLMPNSNAAMALVLGVQGQGRVPAMLNFTAGAEGLQSAIAAAKIPAVFTSRTFVDRAKLQPVLDRLQGVRIIYLEDLRPNLKLADKLWIALRAYPFPRSVARFAKPEDPAVILFTSGSEGKPKGVVLSSDSIWANIAQCLAIFDVSTPDKFLSALPIFHSFGLTIGLFLPLLNGIRIYFYPTPLHYSVIPEIVYDRDCTVLAGTNTFLRHYGNRANPYDFRRVRILIEGAEKLTEDVQRLYMEKFGVRVIEGYGATECSPVISGNSPFAARLGTVGQILPCMESQLETVPGIDQGGLLHVRGPNIMMGYLRDSAPGVLEPPSSSFGAGWYSTGDLASFDADGFLTLLGRLKRFAKVAGEMISLEVVERIAGTASVKAAHAAVTRPDPRRGEMIVLLTEDPNLRRDQLQEAARSIGAPELAIPRQVVFLQKIPILGNGKKDYVKMQSQLEELLAQRS